MAENSKIEWTTHTFNPWWGCSKVAAGCTNCYADALSKRTGRAQWGEYGTRVLTSEANWREPLKWNKAAEAAGERHRVFCASMADVFEDWSGAVLCHAGYRLINRLDGMFAASAFKHVGGEAPSEDFESAFNWTKLADVRRKLFALIDATPHLDWLLLTKRPENIRRMWECPPCYCHRLDGTAHDRLCPYNSRKPRHNVWLGTSIATQADADRNIPELLKCRDLAPMLFLSCEPLLGPVSLTEVQVERFAEIDCLRGKTGVHRPLAGDCPKIDWVIVGGESGPKARPIHPDWARSIRDQCQAAGVPFFFKQWGEWVSDKDSPSPRKVMTDTPFGPLEMSEKQTVRIVRCDGGDRVFNANGTFSGEGPQEDDAWMVKVGKKRAGRRLDGVEHSQFPVGAHA